MKTSQKSPRKFTKDRPAVKRQANKSYLFEKSWAGNSDQDMESICPEVIELECYFRIQGFLHQDPIAIFCAASVNSADRQAVNKGNVIDYYNQFYQRIRPIDRSFDQNHLVRFDLLARLN
jgi:hypothetical protein